MTHNDFVQWFCTTLSLDKNDFGHNSIENRNHGMAIYEIVYRTRRDLKIRVKKVDRLKLILKRCTIFFLWKIASHITKTWKLSQRSKQNRSFDFFLFEN